MSVRARSNPVLRRHQLGFLKISSKYQFDHSQQLKMNQMLTNIFKHLSKCGWSQIIESWSMS